MGNRRIYVSLAVGTFLLAAASSCTDGGTVTCTAVDPLLKVFPENTAFMDAPDTLDAAGNTHVEFQFALRSDAAVNGFTVECGELAGPEGKTIPAPRCGVVGYVGVGDCMDYPAHDVLKSATGLFPDPILEQESYDFDPFVTFCPWITVHVPAGTPEGVYTGEVRMEGTSGGRKFSFCRDISVRVWPVTMDTPDFPNVNWAFDFDLCMKLWNGGETVERYSEDHREYLRQLYGILAEGHQTVTRIPVWDVVGMEYGSDGKWKFDFTRFDEYIAFCEEAGVVQSIQIEELGHRIVPSWTAPMGLFVPKKPAEDGSPESAGSPSLEKETLAPSDSAAKEFYSSFIPALRTHLEQTGWAGRCYQQICDEPIDANADSYRQAVDLIRRYWPDMKVLEACQTTKVTGAVDAWCPQLDYWHENYSFYSDRQNQGDEVWFYTCCFPHGEYPNRFIEQPLLKPRMIFWMAHKYRADGYLHWGFNYWSEDPFAETSRSGTGTYLPGGDCWIIYPGDRKMLRSIRFEQHRDGIEDLTLLRMLAAKDPARADAIVNSLITNWWVYAGNPATFRQARLELLKALAGLDKPVE